MMRTWISIGVAGSASFAVGLLIAKCATIQDSGPVGLLSDVYDLQGGYLIPVITVIGTILVLIASMIDAYQTESVASRAVGLFGMLAVLVGALPIVLFVLFFILALVVGVLLLSILLTGGRLLLALGRVL